MRPQYRWAVLTAGTAAQAAFSALLFALPVLAPAVRDAYELTLGEVGLALSSVWVGTTSTLLPWGVLADRIGERTVLALGVGTCAALVAAAAAVDDFVAFVALLTLAGAAGASVNAASGRAVMAWFPADERGFALGLRQTAIPVGGLVAAVALPALEDAAGLAGAFMFLAALCGATAASAAVVLREPAGDAVEPEAVPWTLRDRRLWRLSTAGGLYLVAQAAIIGFVVLFLHDERGLSNGAAAAVLAAIQVVAVALRIGAGRWSDVLGSRIVPLRRVGLTTVVALTLAAALFGAPIALLVPVLVAAGGFSMAWNGLSFAAAAELAGRARSGAAIGLQQTVLSAIGFVVPVAFATTVSATSWRIAFTLAALGPLAGWFLLRGFVER